MEVKRSRKMLLKDAAPTIYYINTDAGTEKLIVQYPYDEDQLPEVLFQEETNDKKEKMKEDKAQKRLMIESKKELRESYKLLFEKNQKLKRFKDLCRVCGEKREATIGLSTLCDWRIDLNDIMTVFELTINTFLSELICEECFENLVTFANFKKNCKEAELKILQELAKIDPEKAQLPNIENSIVDSPVEEDEYVDALDEYVDEMESNKSHDLDLNLRLDPFDENMESVANLVNIEECQEINENIEVFVVENSKIDEIIENKEITEITSEVSKNKFYLQKYKCYYCKKVSFAFKNSNFY